jgi:hypothetical protein
MSMGEREHSKRTPMDFYLSQCCDKISHDKKSATKEAKRLSKKHHKGFKEYYCTFCHNWHVGKVKRISVNNRNKRGKYNNII